MERDRRNVAALEEAGWKSLIIWECETGDRDHVEQMMRRFLIV